MVILSVSLEDYCILHEFSLLCFVFYLAFLVRISLVFNCKIGMLYFNIYMTKISTLLLNFD